MYGREVVNEGVGRVIRMTGDALPCVPLSRSRGIDRTKWYDEPRRLGAHFFDIVRVLSRLSPPVEQLVGGKLKSEQSRSTFSRNRKARLGILAPTISASRYLIVRDTIFGFLHRSVWVPQALIDHRRGTHTTG